MNYIYVDWDNHDIQILPGTDSALRDALQDLMEEAGEGSTALLKVDDEYDVTDVAYNVDGEFRLA